MWGDHKISWKKGSPNAAGRGAVQSNNEILPELDFQQKRFQGGYAKRFGEWNRVVIDNVVEIPEVEYKKKEGWLFVCGYISPKSSYYSQYSNRYQRYYAGELKYDTFTESFEDIWKEAEAWAISDSITSRRLSDDPKKVGLAFIDINCSSYSIYRNPYLLQIIANSATDDKKYNCHSVFPMCFPYIKRFEYQSITKSSLDQQSIFKRSEEYYSKVFVELFETPRQNINLLKYNYDSSGFVDGLLKAGETDLAGEWSQKCSCCGKYNISNEAVEEFRDNMEEYIPRNVSTEQFTLHSIDHETNKETTNQSHKYYMNVAEFNFKPNPDYSITFRTNEEGEYTSFEIDHSFRYAFYEGKSTLMEKEKSDITKFDYDYRISFLPTLSFLGIDVLRIISSTKTKELSDTFYAYDQTENYAIMTKEYSQSNTYGYRSYFHLYNIANEYYEEFRNYFYTEKKDLLKRSTYASVPLNADSSIEDEIQYYDYNTVRVHSCPGKDYGGIPRNVWAKYAGDGSASYRVAGSFKCNKPSEGGLCFDVNGMHYYTIPGDIYLYDSSSLGSDYNNAFIDKAGITDPNNLLKTDSVTYPPSSDFLDYNKDDEDNEYTRKSDNEQDPFIIKSPNGYNFYYSLNGANRTYYIPQTFYSKRMYHKDREQSSNTWDRYWVVEGNEESGYTFKRITKTSNEHMYDRNNNLIETDSKWGDVSKSSDPIINISKNTKTETLEDGKTQHQVADDGFSMESVKNVYRDITDEGMQGVGLDTGYTFSPSSVWEYIDKKGRPYLFTDFPVFCAGNDGYQPTYRYYNCNIFAGLFVDFLDSAASSFFEGKSTYEYYYLDINANNRSVNNWNGGDPVDIFDIFFRKNKQQRYLSGENFAHSYTFTPGTGYSYGYIEFICRYQEEGDPYNITWHQWWLKLGMPRNYCIPTGRWEEWKQEGDSIIYVIRGNYKQDDSLDGGVGTNPNNSTYNYYLTNLDSDGARWQFLSDDNETKQKITGWYGADIPDYYLLDFQSYFSSYSYSGTWPCNFSASGFIKVFKNNMNVELKRPSVALYETDYVKYVNFLIAPWEKNQVTLYGCTPYGEQGSGEDENGIKYNNKYFIFDEKNERSPWEPTTNYPNMQNRFYKNQTPYKNYLMEGVYPSGDDNSFIMVNAWMTDIEEGFSGIELKVEGFTNLANGKCTTGFNVPCDTAMISKVSIDDLNLIEHTNIFTKDDDSGYTTNKGVFPVLKGLWQERKTNGKYGDKKAIFAIETQCMIEGPEYYFSHGPDDLPPGFEKGYKGYKSRGLLISVAAGGVFTNHFIGEECGFFDYFKPQNEKRYPINARRAYDDDPEDMRKEVGYYWDFEEAFGPYEIGSCYTFETQLAGKMSFAVTLGDYTTHILLMLAYDIDKWPTSAEDTPSEYEHPEIAPEEEYLFKAAFLTADLSKTEPQIPHPFKDFQMRHAIHPLVERSKEWTNSKLKDANRKFFEDNTNKDKKDIDEEYVGTGKEYEGITVPKSFKEKLWGERVWYEYNEDEKFIEENLDIKRGVVRLIRWRNFTWREKKLDSKGNPVTKNGKQQWIEHQDALAECAVSYTMDEKEYVDLFYTGKGTVFLRFYKDDSKLVKKKKAGEIFEGDDKEYKNVETCEGDVCIENLRLPEQMVWLKKTGEGETATFKEYLLKLTGLGIFDIVTLYQASKEEEDPDSSFEVVTIPVMADDGKTYFCVSKDCKNWEISGVIGQGFLSHTAAGEKGAVSEVIEENTK